MIKSTLLPAFFTAALLGAPALAAQTPLSDTPAHSRSIEIDRAALNTQAGAQAAYDAIRAAARSACRAENRGGADFERGVRLCVADTVDRTVARIDAPVLTALHGREAPARVLASAH